MLKDGSSNGSGEQDAVLDFWFGDLGDSDNVENRNKLWFRSTVEQDEAVRERFGGLHQRAARGELAHWVGGPRGALALVVVLDQFSRNLYRGKPEAFANDTRALAIGREALQRGFDEALGVVERLFLYLPFEHSESLADQHESVRLFTALDVDAPPALGAFSKRTLEYATLHRDIIARFGRFPHRNELLGRSSTEEEIEYLQGGGQRFGQISSR